MNVRLIIRGLIFRTKKIWPAKLYLSLLYRLYFKSKLDFDNPKTFSEKLNWMKIYGRNDLYTQMADKFAVKALVSQKIGEQYVVKNYGCFNSWEEIDFDKLPDQFVIKCTHDSGGAFVCRDKKTFDFEKVKKTISSNMQRTWYWTLREWPYKDIKHRIIIDEMLDDKTGTELRDYKFWCFNGKPTYMYFTIKGKNVYENFYDMNFQPVEINHGFPRHKPEFEKPEQFELMKELATKLSNDIPFVRIDFFLVENKVYFGEYTFFDWGGMRPFADRDVDLALGNLLALPTKQ